MEICIELRENVDTVPSVVVIPVVRIRFDFFVPCPEVILPSRRENSLERFDGTPPSAWDESLPIVSGKEHTYPA